MKKVLVPVDFSPSSEKALGIARDVFAGAQIKLIHIFDERNLISPYIDGFSPGVLLEEQRKELMTAAETKLNAMKGDAEAEVVVGVPVDSILKAANGWGADFIVMGTHGRKGLQHFFFGSVAEEVIRQSLVPVLVARE